MPDISIKCRDCGEEFVFTEGEQQFYAEKGFENQPTRCRDCRAAKKAQNRRPFNNNRSNVFNTPRISKF